VLTIEKNELEIIHIFHEPIVSKFMLIHNFSEGIDAGSIPAAFTISKKEALEFKRLFIFSSLGNGVTGPSLKSIQ
jgi:hypothetical protein